jgi:hypothetical protein
MPVPTWKLDAALRDRLGGTEPLAIAVQPLAQVTRAEEQQLAVLGLAPPMTPGGLWSGSLTPTQVGEVAGLVFVGYVHAAASEPPRPLVTRGRYQPPAPAKRGHTKLPPRRQ